MTSPVFNNYCKWNSTTAGTGAFTVGAAAVTDYVGPHDIPANCDVADGASYRYYAQTADGTQTEGGYGTYAASTHTLARTTVDFNSSGTTSPLNFATDPIVDLFPPPPQTLSSKFTSFPTGTSMVFHQATPPPNWTRDTSFNDAVLRVVSGTPGSGGSNSFSSVMSQTVVGSHTLSIGEIPSHAHGISGVSGAGCCGSLSGIDFIFNGLSGASGGTGANGGGGAHNHAILMDMKYVDIILATRN